MDSLQAVLQHLRAATGLDFADHRRATIERRLKNRMASLAIGSGDDYLRHLRQHREEANALVDRLTVKVSRFYRNAPAFDCLREAILPALARAAQGRPVAAWSAGCARGEEAYTLAMLLEEAGIRGGVLATDIDAAALSAAAVAEFPEASCRELPRALRRFLEPGSRHDTVRVAAAVRDRVVFRQGDVQEPFATGRFDLVACRNVLIYLSAPARARAFAHLEAALRPGGYLLLGESEWAPPAPAGGLRVVEGRARVFQSATEEDAA